MDFFCIISHFFLGVSDIFWHKNVKFSSLGIHRSFISYFCVEEFLTPFYHCNRLPCLFQEQQKKKLLVVRKVRFYKENHFKPSSHTCRTTLCFFRTLPLSASLVSHFFKTIKIREKFTLFSFACFCSCRPHKFHNPLTHRENIFPFHWLLYVNAVTRWWWNFFFVLSISWCVSP